MSKSDVDQRREKELIVAWPDTNRHRRRPVLHVPWSMSNISLSFHCAGDFLSSMRCLLVKPLEQDDHYYIDMVRLRKPDLVTMATDSAAMPGDIQYSPLAGSVPRYRLCLLRAISKGT